MTPSAFSQHLRRFRHAHHDVARSRELAGVLREALEQSRWLDARTYADVVRQLAERSASAPAQLWRPPALRPGETYLLVHDHHTGASHATLLRAVRAGAPAEWTRLDAGAMYEARRALRGLFAVAARRCRSFRLAPDDVELEHALEGDPRIDGPSLGLAACVAFLSMELGRASRSDVAGTAEVSPWGDLRPVGAVRSKLTALADRWPNVRTAIAIAEGPGGAPDPDPIGATLDVIAPPSLEDALAAFGLDLGDLEAARLERHVARARTFDEDNARPHSPEQWRRLSAQAAETSEALHVSDPESSARALAWSALFALHAGDVGDAQQLLGRVPAGTALTAEHDVWRAIVAASTAIDVEPRDAIDRSATALSACRALGDRGRALLGMALGTHGRALLHAGRPADALDPLERAVEHHHQFVRREEARSLGYLATALRHAGRHADALAATDHGLHLARDVHADWESSRTTTLYLHLERGRILLDLDRPDDALRSFEITRDGQRHDTDYPRLSALRGIAAAAHALGDAPKERDAVAAIARAATHAREMLQRIAAVGAGEALSRGVPDGADRRAVETAWRAVFTSSPDGSQVAALARSLVY